MSIIKHQNITSILPITITKICTVVPSEKAAELQIEYSTVLKVGYKKVKYILV